MGRRGNESPPATHCHLVLWGCGSGGQLGRFVHRGSSCLCPLSTSTATCPLAPGASCQVARRPCLVGCPTEAGALSEPAFCRPPAGQLPSLSSLPLLCRGLWFGISFLRQLEPRPPPAWLLQIPLRKTPQRECRRALQDRGLAPGDGGGEVGPGPPSSGPC